MWQMSQPYLTATLVEILASRRFWALCSCLSGATFAQQHKACIARVVLADSFVLEVSLRAVGASLAVTCKAPVVFLMMLTVQLRAGDFLCGSEYKRRC